MATVVSKEQKLELVASMRRYFSEQLDSELSELQAGFFLEYVLTEIAPLAYNQGVEDARSFVLAATSDLSGACFQEALTYWSSHGTSREVRRKPGR